MADRKLNSEQQAAITHGEGPLLIIAGAGTGKTTVITERIKWLINEGKARADEILALTFTEKAAKEMEERVDLALPYGYTQLWVMTFHSFCDRILRNEAIHMGLDPNYDLLSETDATDLLHKHLFTWDLDYFRPLGNPYKFIGGILQHFSRLQDEDISPLQYHDWTTSLQPEDEAGEVDSRKFSELARIFEKYQSLKAKQSVMDFGDLISNTLALFRTRPNVLKEYQKRFKYILIDEYQDTNYAQNQLILQLAGQSPNLTVVADDDQSIYRWRGAAVSNVIQFRRTFPEAKLVVLTQNYRSSQEILDRAYALIQHNNPDRLEVKENINKKLISSRKIKGEPVDFIHCDRVENEADAVAQEIVKLRRLRPELAYRDFAILVRANAHAEPFTRALSRHGLPFQFLGPGQLFHQPEIKDLIAYLHVLDDLDDDVSFYRVLCMNFFQIHPRDLMSIGNFAKRNNLHLFTACEAVIGQTVLNTLTNQAYVLPVVSTPTKDILKKIIGIVNSQLALIPRETAGQILFFFLQETGLLKSIMDYQLPIDEKKATNIMKFFNKLKSFEATHDEAGVSAAVNWIDLSMELGESPLAADSDWTENDAVNLITIHSSKGLEFPIVFLVNLVSQRFPSVARPEQVPIPDALIKEILPSGDFHLQEERRLFYVGMTRACDKLYLTAADFYGEAKRTKKLSPFIAEALGEAADQTGLYSSAQLSLLDWQKSPTVPSAHSPVSPVRVDYLSYSQIQTFLDCPLHYKAKYIIKIPTPPSAASSFGNTIHQTMREYYDLFKRQYQPDMSKIFAKNWSNEGYLNARQAALYFKKGQQFLQEYLKSEFNPDQLPQKLEEPFTVPLGNLKIGGKIDRVDLLPDGRIEIIDYKTSAHSLTQKDADDDLQLSFYALAASIITQPPFNRKPEDILLSLYYFEERKKVTTTRTAEQLAAARQKILDYAVQISQSEFACSGAQICHKCDFKMLCDFKTSD
jgi:DNA helicase II / ATP-dependent DNA helicase PcrA